MKSISKFSLAVVGAIVLAIVSAPLSHAGSPVKTWKALDVPGCFAAWTVTKAPSGVYVGGSGNDRAPGVWNYRNSKWTRILRPAKAVGAVNAVAADDLGNINATLVGTSYSWRTEFEQYDPIKKTWTNRGFSNSIIMDMTFSGNLALMVGTMNPLGFDYGLLKLYVGNTQITEVFSGAKSFSAVTGNSPGGVFVAGNYKDYPWLETPEPNAGQPGLWFFDGRYGKEFEDITPWTLPRIVEFTDLTNTREGTLYIAGLDAMDDAHVWSYRPERFADTGLEANQVACLTVDAGGRVYAAGLDNDNHGQVWLYIPGTDSGAGTWESLQLEGSAYVRAFNVDKNGAIYAVGADGNGHPKLWMYR